MLRNRGQVISGSGPGPWCIAAVLATCALGPPALAATPHAAKVSGKVAAISPAGIKVTSPLGSVMVSASQSQLAELFPGKDDKLLSVLVTGDAEINFLAKGQGVTFNAELAGGRTSRDEVRTLTLFTPDATHRLEMTETAPSLDDNGAPSDRVSSYIVSGKIQSFRDGQLIVTVPNERGKEQSIRVRVADDAKISVQMGDISIARPGDSIDVDGYALTPAGQPLTAVVAESIKVVAAKPLVNPKRAKAQALAARTPLRPERKPRTSQKADQPEPDEVEVAASAPTPASTGAQPQSKLPPVVRQPGDPPAEALVLRDEFSVDEPPAPVKAPAGKVPASKAK